MASIVEREGIKGTTYQVRYRIDGRQKTKTFAAKREANRFAKEIEAKITLGQAKEEHHITFREYANQFFEIQLLNAKITTKKSYNYLLNTINKYIGEKKLKDITANYLDRIFLKLDKEYKYNTIRSIKKLINLVLKSAAKKEIIAFNPVDRMDYRLVNTERHKQKNVSDEHIKLLIEYFESKEQYKYKHFTQIALMTGMRTGEIIALREENVTDFIHVVENYNRWGEITTPKTKRSIRDIYIHKPLQKVLDNIQNYNKQQKELFGSSYNDNGLLVCHEDGNYMSNIAVSKAFQTASNNLNIHITPHMLRHTFATKLRMVETKDVQELLGHTSVEMTVNTYQHHDKYTEETIDILNETFKHIN